MKNKLIFELKEQLEYYLNTISEMEAEKAKL